jgi:hypothetical protein
VKAGDNNAVQGRRRAEDWDATVLVWNGTVARIPMADLAPDSAEGMAGVDDEQSQDRDPRNEEMLSS